MVKSAGNLGDLSDVGDPRTDGDGGGDIGSLSRQSGKCLQAKRAYLQGVAPIATGVFQPRYSRDDTTLQISSG